MREGYSFSLKQMKKEFSGGYNHLRRTTTQSVTSLIRAKMTEPITLTEMETQLEEVSLNISSIYNGRVIQELCERVLSRRVAESNVLIVAPDIEEEEIILPSSDSSVVGTTISSPVALHSLSQGHTTYMLPSSTNLNEWWNNAAKNEYHAKWFLLSYFLSSNDRNGKTIDDLLGKSRAQKLLQEATLTYVVLNVHASSIGGEQIQIAGLQAVQTLLDANYKVQLLSSSHFDEREKYRPNHLFKSQYDLKRYLSSGVAIVKENEKFEALLFATQGLDLAIPSRLSYITLDRLPACVENPIVKKSGRCDSKIELRALGQDIFLKCPEHHHDISINFDSDSSNGIKVLHHGEHITDPSKMEVWVGAKDIDKAECVCVRIKSEMKSDKFPVSCTTRIIKEGGSSTDASSSYQNSSQNLSELELSKKVQSNEMKTMSQKRKMNFLSILIDPLSRSQMQRSLPNTLALLTKLNFAEFNKYTSVGPNSGPNQAALFTGLPLVGGREGIKGSASHENVKNDNYDEDKPEWLWDEFRESGYATLKVEDICIENSNMVQSMKPVTTHGGQLFKMFCFDFDRPNCLGKDMAAKHIMNYTESFMKTYNSDDRPWAGFVSFVDSHEDTLTLISYLDELLVNFLQTIDLAKTVVVFSSDHGLHYGPSFAANGEKERAEPILYIHSPEDITTTAKRNQEMWVTPYDVHETILDIVLERPHSGKIGNSIRQPFPYAHRVCLEKPGIPPEYCSMILNIQPNDKKSCSFIPNTVPSIHSFYADISSDRRPSWPRCDKKTSPQIRDEDCICAFSNYKKRKNWLINCSKPLLQKKWKNLDAEGDPLRMKVCRKKDGGSNSPQVIIDVSFRPKKDILARKRSIRSKDSVSRPNILFLEIDSLSRLAADRHMPKTLSILQAHEMLQTDGKVECPSGFCAAIFNRTSVIGQNSIPNQLAALSGCSDTMIEGSESYKRPQINVHSQLKAWCPKSSEIKNPFLFNITKKLGYVTLFGEEFCYDRSPWVVQNNLFELEADYDMQILFCQLARMLREEQNLGDMFPLFSINHDNSTNAKPCIDGRSRQEFAFEYIRGMWNAYPEDPKFAYVNSLAAHDYSTDLAYQNLGIEAYDEYLSSFLKEMLDRPDAKDTIIVLRSDHGLQGGPAAVDYSAQVEHLNPFNSLIIPTSLRGEWMETLYSNQDKLVTGYDLYHTLRNLISPTTDNMKANPGNIRDSGIPDWSFDILSDPISNDRSCEDAKIPNAFCPCIEERKDFMPHFYVGHAEQLNNIFGIEIEEDSNGRFSTKKISGKKYEERTTSEKDKAVPHDMVTSVLQNTPANCEETSHIKGLVQKVWDTIDKTVLTHTLQNSQRNKVSGGLFLYPQQSLLLEQMIQALLKDHPYPKFNVCETGFGAGHSSSFFLSQNENIEIVTFDKFDRNYQLPILNILRDSFQERIVHVMGNSCLTLPSFFQKNTSHRCDLLHGSSLCPKDNIDLVYNAKCGTILTSTAMSSIDDKDVYFGPNAQWRKLRSQNCISDITCFTEDKKVLKESFRFSKKDETIQHQFCFAVVTGQCTLQESPLEYLKEGSICEERRVKARKVLSNLCQSHKIEVPQ